MSLSESASAAQSGKSATGVASSPWAMLPSTAAAAPCSFEQVMSEQLANDLHEKDVKRFIKFENDLMQSLQDYDVITASEVYTTDQQSTTTSNSTTQDAVVLPTTTTILTTANSSKTSQQQQQQQQHDCEANNSDFLLAQLLQLEMDKEYDEQLRQREQLRNKHSRVAVSYDKFRQVHPLVGSAESDEDARVRPEVASDSSESEDELEVHTFRRGVRGKGDDMISKHDLALSAKHNASKVMMFPPSFETGDSHRIDMRLSNKVYNALKMHSLQADKRLNRLHDKQDTATSTMSLDAKTRLILFKLVNADVLGSIGGVVSTGKEATIFYATGGKSQELLVPAECVAKVFKTTLNEFKTREKYIGDDYRFKDRYKHLNPQKIVKLWAEKEMHNLMKMRKYGIPCPEVVALKRHVLIMSFIGVDSKPAPKLKEAQLDATQLRSAYEQCVQLIKDLYHQCNLVHADFNQFNLLWHEERVWCIDVSQSVEPIHPMGLEFLLRDCTNVYKFFTNRKLDNVMTGEEIFNEVTQMNFTGEGTAFLSQIQKYRKDKDMQLNVSLNRDDDTKQSYNFDYYFEKSCANKSELAATGCNADSSDH